MLSRDNHNWQSRRALKDFRLDNRKTEFRARDGNERLPQHAYLQVKGNPDFPLESMDAAQVYLPHVTLSLYRAERGKGAPQVHSDPNRSTCQLQTVQEAIHMAHVMGALVVVIGSWRNRSYDTYNRLLRALPVLGWDEEGNLAPLIYIPRLGNHVAERQHSPWGRKTAEPRNELSQKEEGISISQSSSKRIRKVLVSCSASCYRLLVPAPWHRMRRRHAYAEHVR